MGLAILIGMRQKSYFFFFTKQSKRYIAFTKLVDKNPLAFGC